VNRRLILGGVVLLFVAAGLCWWQWSQGSERRASLQAVQSLCLALEASDAKALLNAVALPRAIEHQTPGEQAEFITKALRDEVSRDGLAVLRRYGTYGTLKEIFPAEASSWASQAQVNPDECVAFKLERNGLRAEAVLVKVTDPLSKPSTRNTHYQIVRLNDVKQMADLNL
jgi:hypothetical protein